MVKSFAMLGELYSTITFLPLAGFEPYGRPEGASRITESTAWARVSGASFRLR